MNFCRLRSNRREQLSLGTRHCECRSVDAHRKLWPDTRSVHTPVMTLKNAALLALIGTMLMTALLVWVFVSNLVNVLRGADAPVVLFSSFIYAVGGFTLMVSFFVFHRVQRVVVISARTAPTITATRRRLEQPQWFLEV